MSDPEFIMQTLACTAQPLTGSPRDFDTVIEQARHAHVVLIGEATHGTHEFYSLRAQISRRLIEELGFGAVAVEADWPDAYRINRYVMGGGSDNEPKQALLDFKRFPSWMWRNNAVVDFVGWLRKYNGALPDAKRVGLYGLDLYSLHTSIGQVIGYLDQFEPELARRARERYACFEGLSERPEAYTRATALGVASECEQAVIEQLRELRGEREAALRRDGLLARDEHFHAEQNARVILDAERYYRALLGGQVESWNLRDTHMADVVDSLLKHVEHCFAVPKIVVWAHNSHVGDARATELGELGQLNLGQLLRERHPDRTLLIGFSTYWGTVAAASNWGGTVERKQVRPGLYHSYEHLFHGVGATRAGASDFILQTSNLESTTERYLQRAIGVVYRPETERHSHYFMANVRHQFDFMIHVDRSRAVEPLDHFASWPQGELPETFPSGL